MKEHIDALRTEALSAIATASTLRELDETYRRYCGKQGIVTEIKREVGRLMARERGNACAR